MPPARILEHRIARQLLRRREQGAPHGRGVRPPVNTLPFDAQPWADRVIAILAVTTGLLLAGSYVEELLWAALAASAVCTLR